MPDTERRRPEMIRLETLEGLAVVSILGEVDLSNSAAIDEAIALLDNEAVVVLSLEQCTFLDNAVLNVMIRRHRTLGGNLIVVVPDGHRLGRIFDITGLREALHVVPGRRAAVELAATMRDVGAVHFSRDGVLDGPT